MTHFLISHMYCVIDLKIVLKGYTKTCLQFVNY